MNLKESLKLFSLASFSSKEELKKRYRELIKIYHPDRHPKNPHWSTKTMQDLNTAYDILNKSLKKSSPPVKKVITNADEALKNAIIIGCLKRWPKNRYMQSFRDEITEAADYLGKINLEKGSVHFAQYEYFGTLFSVFLRVTDPKNPKPFPAAINNTKFFRQFSLANRNLETGIRDFYHYLDKGQIEKHTLVPLSYLADALYLYSFLIPLSRDRINLKVIKTRMELCHLFKLRIIDPGLEVL